MTQGSKQRLLLKQIRLDGGTQARVNMRHEPTISEYADKYKEGVQLPDPTVFRDEDGNYWLADGFQRCYAKESIGAIEMDCYVIEGSLRDAILFSTGANEDHGLKRTDDDRRKAVETLLNDKEWGNASGRWIASQAKVSHAMVNRMLAKRREESTGTSSSAERVVKTSDGKLMNVSKIAESNKNRRQDEESDQRPERETSDDGYDNAQEDEPFSHTEPEEVDERDGEESAVISRDTATAGEAFKEAMAEVPKFKELIKALDELKRKAYDLSEGPAGHHMAWNRVEIEFRNVRSHIKDAIPVAPCEVCGGDGCSDCRMGGFITESYAKSLKASA